VLRNKGAGYFRKQTTGNRGQKKRLAEVLQVLRSYRSSNLRLRLEATVKRPVSVRVRVTASS
jgi:hypothetical protein